MELNAQTPQPLNATQAPEGKTKKIVILGLCAAIIIGGVLYWNFQQPEKNSAAKPVGRSDSASIPSAPIKKQKASQKEILDFMNSVPPAPPLQTDAMILEQCLNECVGLQEVATKTLCETSCKSGIGSMTAEECIKAGAVDNNLLIGQNCIMNLAKKKQDASLCDLGKAKYNNFMYEACVARVKK